MNYLIYWNFHFYLFHAHLLNKCILHTINNQTIPIYYKHSKYIKKKKEKILKIRKLQKKKKLLLLSLFLFLLIN